MEQEEETAGVDYVAVIAGLFTPIIQPIASLVMIFIAMIFGGKSTLQDAPRSSISTPTPIAAAKTVPEFAEVVAESMVENLVAESVAEILVAEKAAPASTAHPVAPVTTKSRGAAAATASVSSTSGISAAGSSTTDPSISEIPIDHSDRIDTNSNGNTKAAGSSKVTKGAASKAVPSKAASKPASKPQILSKQADAGISSASQGDDNDEDDDDISDDDLLALRKEKNRTDRVEREERAAEAERAKRVKFVLPTSADDEGDGDGDWEVKKGKKASETAEQRTKRLQRQKDAKLAKKLALEKEAADLLLAEEQALQDLYAVERAEQAARESERAAMAAAVPAASSDSAEWIRKDRDEDRLSKLQAKQHEQLLQKQRALALLQKEEEGIRAAIALSIAEQQMGIGLGGASLPPGPNAYPSPMHDLHVHRPSAADLVDSNIADIQRNIVALKQVLHIGAEPAFNPAMEFLSYSNGVLHPVAPPAPLAAHPMYAHGSSSIHMRPALPSGGMMPLGALMPPAPPAGANNIQEGRAQVKLVGGNLLTWLEPFHIRLEYGSRLSSPRMSSSSLDTPDILIFFLEFPAGMGPVIAGRREEKLMTLQRGSGCIIAVTYDEEVGCGLRSLDRDSNRSGSLRITGTQITIPVFIKLFDAQMLGCLEYIQSRKYAPRPRRDAAEGRLGVAPGLSNLAPHAPEGGGTGHSPHSPHSSQYERLLSHGIKGGNGGNNGHSTSNSHGNGHGRTSEASGAGSGKDSQYGNGSAKSRVRPTATADFEGSTSAPAPRTKERKEGAPPEGPEDVEGSCEVFFEVPEEHTGYVIGKQGMIIKSLMIKTGTYIALVSQNPVKKGKEVATKRMFVTPNPGMSRFRIKGTDEAVDSVVAQFTRNLAKIEVELTVLT